MNKALWCGLIFIAAGNNPLCSMRGHIKPLMNVCAKTDTNAFISVQQRYAQGARAHAHTCYDWLSQQHAALDLAATKAVSRLTFLDPRFQQESCVPAVKAAAIIIPTMLAWKAARSIRTNQLQTETRS